MSLIAFGFAAIALGHVVLTVFAMVGLGLVYAHLVELQHECLHHHAFRSRRLNRIFGFLSGVFLLSNYSHYRYEHLLHHANLGSPDNGEFFNYRFRNLDSFFGFAKAAFHLGRFVDVGRAILQSFGSSKQFAENRDRESDRIRTEYRLLLLCVVAAVAAALVWNGLWFLVLAWLLPALLVGEPAHFLIEMPEHFGLNTQTNPNVLTNTRTIRAGRMLTWFTNMNNLHTAHHFNYSVPMVNVRRLYESAMPDCPVVEPSYWSFFGRVVRGDLRYRDWSETCMTR